MRSRSRFSAPLRLNSFGEERGHRTPNSAPPSSTILRCSTIASASTQPSVTSPPLRRRPTSTRRAPHESVSTEVREGQPLYQSPILISVSLQHAAQNHRSRSLRLSARPPTESYAHRSSFLRLS